MRILLDTHTLLWWLAGDKQLSLRARRAIAGDANEVFVSAASAWEVTTKARIGKLPRAGRLAVDFAHEVRQQCFVALPISRTRPSRRGLAGDNRDTFDRMLIAQAREEKMALVSSDAMFDGFGVRRIR